MTETKRKSSAQTNLIPETCQPPAKKKKEAAAAAVASSSSANTATEIADMAETTTDVVATTADITETEFTCPVCEEVFPFDSFIVWIQSMHEVMMICKACAMCEKNKGNKHSYFVLKKME